MERECTDNQELDLGAHGQKKTEWERPTLFRLMANQAMAKHAGQGQEHNAQQNTDS